MNWRPSARGVSSVCVTHLSVSYPRSWLTKEGWTPALWSHTAPQQLSVSQPLLTSHLPMSPINPTWLLYNIECVVRLNQEKEMVEPEECLSSLQKCVITWLHVLFPFLFSFFLQFQKIRCCATLPQWTRSPPVRPLKITCPWEDGPPGKL